ncbi:Activating signal cointegrator 1 complex subunit like [Quillaja saponaria]|uniref:Activating signal cointegrator 1 complex subunit like n=1 Tax=Quillaja saponaria TaxID=32244 RepID=A0AAD7PT52_QUISA|nr:Activating signal cointegrator 1 complex subunit like [Quillaja saponaria]
MNSWTASFKLGADGARAADGLSIKEHEAILLGKKLLDLPKLLNLCALHSHGNEEMTRMLVLISSGKQFEHDSPRLQADLLVAHYMSWRAIRRKVFFKMWKGI